MRLLDLFCCAGGAAMGYARAGFEVIGVDKEPQSQYPFEFQQADVLELDPLWISLNFNAVHASPPCQVHSSVTGKSRGNHVDLVPHTRELLRATGLPYIIENVEGAPLHEPIRLCGSSFDLDVQRHRLFEIGGWSAPTPPKCQHHRQTPRFRSLNIAKHRAGKLATVVGVHGHINYSGEFELRCKAMGIDWMDNEHLVEALPPAYTKWLGDQLMEHLAIQALA
jgi:DNA (cytosine-5)-methyltransferase 1